MADYIHIAAGSPCIGTGSTNYWQAAWTLMVSRGSSRHPSAATSFYPGASGSLAVAISSDHTEAVPGFILDFTGQISGRASANTWDFGDGTVICATKCLMSGTGGWHPVIIR